MKLLIFMALTATSYAVLADPSQVSNQALISSSGVGYNGALSVNQAAGDFQQQSNARALADGLDTSASIKQTQHMSIKSLDQAQDASASIQSSAFSAGSGALGVNQSAGAGTQQANAMSISVGSGPISLDDTMLAQSIAVSQVSEAVGSTTGERRVVTDNSAFVGSRGVVQLNQSAGVGNQMANSLSIRVAD